VTQVCEAHDWVILSFHQQSDNFLRSNKSNINQSGTATFLVKVKAHRGEPANERADILADNAIYPKGRQKLNGANG